MRFYITLAFAAFVAFAAWSAVSPMLGALAMQSARLAGV